MAKTTVKKSVKTNNDKAIAKKLAPKKVTSKSNNKTKLATPKKSAAKKLVPIDDSKQKKSPKPSLKLTKSELPNNPIVPQEPNYDECIFTVVSPELGFIKLEGEIPYAVKLQAGITIVKKDSMHYEFKGKDHNGNDIGTIFDCIDQEESDQFMKELIEFTKNGAVSFAPLSKNESPFQPANTKETLVKEENIEGITTVEEDKEIKKIDEFKDKPIHAEDMNSLIESMKANGVTAPPVQNNLPSTNNPQSVLNQNGNINNPVNYSAKVPPSIHTFTKEQKLDELVKYGKSIQETVDGTFQARMQGGLPLSDFNATINQCSKNYTYDVKNDGDGYYLIITFDDMSVRVPEQETEFLKVK